MRSAEKMVPKIGGTVEKVNGSELSYADFAEKYLSRNQPVILTGLMEDWRACEDWVQDDGKPNLPFFAARFGGSRVQVADCGTRDFTDQKRVEMSVAEFVNSWMKISDLKVDTDGNEGTSLLYLKDWHFVKEYPDYAAYRTPVLFLDDWLNLYLDHFRMHDHPENSEEGDEISCSDYRFVYMGAKGTWTPLHADVFRSYSWSANICGKKQWYFLSPSQHHLAFDRYMRSSIYDIFEDISVAMYPGFEKAIWLECTQERNEIIFVPTGWYHQVHNLDTISINSNWFNGYNLSSVWDLLLREYNEAKKYIEDIKDICDDFEGLCQKNLAANAGMDFRDFFILVIRFALASFILLYHLVCDNRDIKSSSSQMVQHLLFNLGSIRSIGLKMQSATTWENCSNASIDLRKTVEDQSFIEFCTALLRTYCSICKQNDLNVDRIQHLVEQTQPGLFIHGGGGPRICLPDDIVTFVDSALNLVGPVN